MLGNWVMQRISIAACLYRLILPSYSMKLGAAFSSVAQGPHFASLLVSFAWTTKAQDVQSRTHLHLQTSQLHHGQGHAMIRHDHDIYMRVIQGLLLCAQGVTHCQ